MDAANPLSRWWFAFVLAAFLGCHSTDKVSTPSARGQGPDPAGPVAPLPPPGVTAPATVGKTGGAVQGQPVSPAGHDSSVKTAGAFSTLPAAARAAELMKDARPQIKVVALIGSMNLVTDQEVIEAVRQRLGEFRSLAGAAREAKERELYDAELRRIIERELILDDMFAKLKKQGRLALVDEIKEFAEKASEQSLRSIRKGYGLTTDEEFQSMLRSQGLTQPVIRRQIERQIMADEYIRSAIKDRARTPGFADIRAFYDRNPADFKSEDRVKWLDIFISTAQHGSPQNAYTYAERVRLEAANGADFLALVKLHDNGLAKGAGGVGVGSKRGEVQPADVEATVWALKPGEVSRLIETATGYHIVKVAERDYAGIQPLDVKVQNLVREKLLRRYREAEYQRMIEELWRKGGVQVIANP